MDGNNLINQVEPQNNRWTRKTQEGIREALENAEWDAYSTIAKDDCDQVLPFLTEVVIGPGVLNGFFEVAIPSEVMVDILVFNTPQEKTKYLRGNKDEKNHLKQI